MLGRSRLAPLVDRALHPARRVWRALRRRRLQGPYRGYLDGMTAEGALRGWVIDRRSGKGRVPVALYAGEALIEVGYANGLREDVRAVTGGEGECGFHFPLSEAAWARIAAADGQVSVRTHGPEVHEIGRILLAVDRTDPGLAKSHIAACRLALDKDLAVFERLLAETATAPAAPSASPPLARHGRMFQTGRVIPEIPLSGQPAYLDYVRYRYRMDEPYAVEPGLESAERYLYWYLTAYRSQERRRVPLSRALIDHLNAPVVMAGQQFTISRIMWWRMAGRPDLMARVNLNDRDSYIATLFWWAHQDCPHMYFEDCLVPDRFADLLRGVHPSRRLDAWPLSYFTERYYLDSPRLQFLDMGAPAGRKMLVLAMLVAAAARPYLLRHIPRDLIARLLEEGPEGDPGGDPGGGSELARFVQALRDEPMGEAEEAGGASSPPPLMPTRARYAAMLRAQGFDLDSYSFLTRDPDGHRYEAAAMAVPGAESPMVDVQLIGPLAKASGLGQATRLSATILRETGLSMRGVDFDLDNPAPEGFSSDSLIEPYGRAKINIIHLNAESTPLAFAYQPDVFSGAYNIGYFFWELDRPAYCHYLGLDLLDEIWVSTDYGVQIYQGAAGEKPVVNVGMCYEETTGITRRDARDFVNRRFRLEDHHYVCLVAFDSFSFVQRKNPVAVLQAFQTAFRDVPNARLVVKTQNRDSVFDPVQVQLWDRVEAITAGDPRIMVMNETLGYRDLLRLKAGADCYVSLHKSEGWGFGMIEAMNLGVPVVCTGYSGNMDFCTPETAWLVGYDEVSLRPGDYIFVRKGSMWAEPRVEDAARALRACHDDPAARAARAEAARAFIRANFSPAAIAQRYGSRLRAILDGIEGR
jgi:glycosyltransferase involved in cell wall biosynthesis